MTSRGLIVLLGALSLARVALADPAPMVIPGTVPDDGSDFELIPFQVPAGVAEIEVQHQNLNSQNILDWGLQDPNGYRGWGGGNTEPAIVGLQAASRSYLPGPLPAGTWNIVLGKASIKQKPAQYQLTIYLRTTATLPAQTTRRPYQPVAALKTGPGWFAGDLHAHSLESGDAQPTLDTMATFAEMRGLDFLEISDHNAVSQLDYLGVTQDAHPHLLLLPGVEFTTYEGHANGIGAIRYVPHEIGLNGINITDAAKAFQQQGAVFSINHPALDLSICIGCSWKHDLSPDLIGSVEIATGAWSEAGQLFDDQAIAFWDGILDKGRHVPAVGGSDDHKGGQGGGNFYSPIGSPTTMVFAKELSAAAIVDAIRQGRTVVKLEGPTDPMVTLTADDGSTIGDTVHGDTKLHITVTGNSGGQLQLVKNGEPQDPVDITSDPFDLVVPVTAPATGEDRWRAQALKNDPVQGNHLITVTSHIWITQALPAAPKAHSGCSVATPSLLVAFAVLLILGRRTRRRS